VTYPDVARLVSLDIPSFGRQRQLVRGPTCWRCKSGRT